MKNINKIRERSVEEILIHEGLITPDQLEAAMDERQVNGDLLVNIIIRNEYLTEMELAKTLVQNYQLPFIYPQDYRVNKEVKELLPVPYLHSHMLYPLDLFGDTLVVVTSGNMDETVIKNLERTTEKEVALFIALHGNVQKMLADEFPLEEIASELNSRMDELFGSS